MVGELTVCPGCGRETTTIAGRCPNCGRLKDPSREPPPRYLARGSAGSAWDLFDLPLAVGYWGPGLLIIVAALLVLSDAVVLAIVAVVAVPLLVYALVVAIRGRRERR